MLRICLEFFSIYICNKHVQKILIETVMFLDFEEVAKYREIELIRVA